MEPNNPTTPQSAPPQPEPTQSTNITMPPAQTQPAPTSPDLVTEAKKLANKIPGSTKTFLQKNYLWIMSALGILAAVAIIFGIVQTIRAAYIQSQMSAMTKELEEKTQLVTKYAAQLGLDVSQSNNPNLRPSVKPDTSTDNKEEETKPTEPEAKPTENYIASSNYIYIGEWGLKIKIPKGLKNISYRFDNLQFAASGEAEAYAVESLCVSGILDSMDATPEAFRVDTQVGLGCLSRTKNPAHADSPNIVKKEDDYYYEYAHPQAVLSTNEEEQKQEIEAVKLVEKMLTTPGNITKF